MVLMVFCLICGFFVSFFVWYAYDNGYEWETDHDVKVRMPSILDLNTTDLETVNSYVKNEIVPAAIYFYLVNDFGLRKRIKDTESGVLMYILISFVPLYLVSAKDSVYFLGTQHVNLIKIFLIPAFFATAVTSYFFYQKKYKIIPFISKMDDEAYEKDKATTYSESSFAKLNNSIIQKRLIYLQRYENAIKNRIYARKILTITTGIIYLFLVLSYYNP